MTETATLGANVVAPEFTQVTPTLYWWSVYDAKCKCEFSRVAHQNGERLVLVDPIELENRTQILSSFTDDHREALTAFLEKRPPDFEGR